MKLKCVVRIAPGSAMFIDEYDTQTGELLKYGDLVQVKFDISKFPGGGFFEDSCKSNTIPYSEFFDVMNQRPKALVVINYNNVGFVVCGPTDWEIYLREPQSFVNSYSYISIPQVCNVELAGLIKAPVYSLSTMQALSKLYILPNVTDGAAVVIIADGIYLVDKVLDTGNEVVQKCKPKYIQMCKNEKAVGLISVNGEVMELLKKDLIGGI